MSMIGVFGICSKSNYNERADLINNGKSVQTEDLIKEIYSELENSAAKLENDKCSGEVYIALFHYLKTVCGVDIRCGMEGFGEEWRNVTGDFDIIVFHEKERVLALEDTIDYDGLLQFINDFFQIDYGNAGQIAWDTLLNNLKSTGAENILIWHLF
ncbi:MAG: hypothetical protein HFJ08_09385 [Lachnospiraceae bacterium]|nr:hypothetical protein [Lachnospiraceae bacterium]MCI9399368.1 hypothetical protein [Lachnospiraceae bacterium]MCX4376330.1 hypothetical protein [Lachnospiraceae bacterium]